MRRTAVFHILRHWLRLNPNDPQADAIYAANLARLVAESPHIDAAVLLAMDGVYDRRGHLLPDRSHLYVPNTYLFDVCRRYPVFLPGPSINPMRADALEELARCDEQGAVVIKWLPPLQHFDPGDASLDPFYAELARRSLPLLGHTGCEHTFPDMTQSFGHPARYRRALEAGVTLIVAHCGAACFLHRQWNRPDEVLKMMDDFPNLYSDTSALASLLKFRRLTRIPYQDYPGRFLHGSDYPIPPLALPFLGSLGVRQALELTFHRNPIEVDWRIKSATRVPGEVFANAGSVLSGRTARWTMLRKMTSLG